MNSDHPNPTLTFDHEGYAAKKQAFDATIARLLINNKTALFDRLAEAGITQVIVNFDGYGDSGQIEDISAFRGNAGADLPGGTVEIQSALWGSAEIKCGTLSVRQALEAMAYDLLGQTHSGWEIDDGAFGEFVFDVAARSITLDHNDRYMATQSYTHAF